MHAIVRENNLLVMLTDVTMALPTLLMVSTIINWPIVAHLWWTLHYIQREPLDVWMIVRVTVKIDIQTCWCCKLELSKLRMEDTRHTYSIANEMITTVANKNLWEWIGLMKWLHTTKLCLLFLLSNKIALSLIKVNILITYVHL